MLDEQTRYGIFTPEYTLDIKTEVLTHTTTRMNLMLPQIPGESKLHKVG